MKPDLALVKDFLAMDRKRFGMSFGICLSGFFSGTLETSGLKFKDVQVFIFCLYHWTTKQQFPIDAWFLQSG